MSKANKIGLKFDYRPLTIPAGATVRINQVATFFMLTKKSSNDNVLISIDDDSFSMMPVGYAYDGRDEHFEHIDIKNPTGVNIDVEYVVSNGYISNNQLIAMGILDVDFTANVIESPSPLTVLSASAVFIEADSSQKEISIQNIGGTTVWYGGDNVNPASKIGSYIESNDGVILTSNARIYLRAETSDSQVCITRHKRV